MQTGQTEKSRIGASGTPGGGENRSGREEEGTGQKRQIPVSPKFLLYAIINMSGRSEHLE